ncbi:mannose-1-phosphate guanylyltransferase [Sulfolobales archaeon HS-7]|nr:mannose-1-phosphate guanylyltransferase [Sulfolobales archaeon HS-7]
MVYAVVVAGGYATRLRPLSLTLPKALFPILGKPIIDYTIDGLLQISPSRILIAARVMADRLINYYKGTGITFEVEKEPLGDGGSLGVIVRKFNINEPVVVVYGDIYSEMDYSELLKFHEKHNCECTLVSTRVKDPRRYGVIIKKDNYVENIIEKPSENISDLINAGIYVFRPKVLANISGKVSIARDILPSLLRNGCIAAYEYKGIWADIGVPKAYMKLNADLLITKYPRGYISNSAKISEKTTLYPPYFIDNNTNIREDSVIEPLTVIGKDNEIGKMVFLSESVLMDRINVGDSTFIKSSIIGNNTKIGKWVHIREDSILGEEVIINDTVLLNQNTIVLPNKEISSSIYERGRIIL